MKYDIIGDIHGCFDELLQLLMKHLGIQWITGVSLFIPRVEQLRLLAMQWTVVLIH